MYLFITLCLTGASIFAAGATLTSLSGQLRFWIMFFGRFIFGLGGGSITISQNQITAGLFKGKELAMAFGFTLTVSRVGSVVNFDLTPWIYREFTKLSEKFVSHLKTRTCALKFRLSVSRRARRAVRACSPHA